MTSAHVVPARGAVLAAVVVVGLLLGSVVTVATSTRSAESLSQSSVQPLSLAATEGQPSPAGLPPVPPPVTSGPPLPNLTSAYDVLNGTRVAENASPAQAAHPTTVFYDPLTQAYLVGGTSSLGLAVIPQSTHLVSEVLGSYWIGDTRNFTEIPSAGLLVATGGGSALTVYSASTYALESVTFLNGPVGNDVVYDAATSEVFATVDSNGSLRAYSASEYLPLIGAVNFTGKLPTGLALDTANGDVYVALSLAGEVAVVSPALNDSVVAIVPVNGAPESVVYDAALGGVLVTVQYPGNVSLINGTSNTVVESLAVAPQTPVGLTVDPVSGDIFVDYQSFNPYGPLTVIFPNNWTSITLNGTGGGGGELIWSATDQAVVAADPFESEVRWISPATFGVEMVAATAFEADAVVSVPDNGGEVVVANGYGPNVAVLDARTGGLEAIAALPSFPVALAYDSGTAQVFVAETSGTVSVLALSNDSVVANFTGLEDPIALAYAASTGDVVEVSSILPQLVVISDSTDSVSATLALPEAATGVTVDSATSTAFAAYTTPLALVGVAAISLSSDAVVATTAVGSSPAWSGPILFDPTSGLLFVAVHEVYSSPAIAALTGSLVLQGTSAVGGGLQAFAIDPTNRELLGAGYNDYSVPMLTVLPTVAGANSSNITGGPGPVAVAFSASLDTGYLTQGWVGTVVVFQYPQALYSVDFSGAGLPTGRGWTVVLNGSVQHPTGPGASFVAPNGTYPYSLLGPSGYRVTSPAPSGTLVVNGTTVTMTVSFARGATDSVTIRETELGPGATWCVDFVWSKCTTAGSYVIENLTPGTYPYSVTGRAGFAVGVMWRGHAIALNGNLTLGHGPATLAIKFRLLSFVDLIAVGLPNGTYWSARVAGQSNVSIGSTLGFWLANGTYSIKVGAVPGYTSHVLVHPVHVLGEPLNVTVDFVPVVHHGGAPTGTTSSVPPVGERPAARVGRADPARELST